MNTNLKPNISYNKSINLSYYLILLFPVSLIFSKFISELIIFVLIFTFIKYNFSLSKLNFFLEPFGILFLIFLVIIISSSLFSEYKWFSLKKSLSFVRFILFSFALCWVLNLKKDLLLNLYKVLIIAQLFLILGAIFEIIFDYNLIYGKKEVLNEYARESLKISSFFGDESILGSYISRLYPLLIALFLINISKLDRNFKFLSYFIFIFSCFVVFFSGERLSTFLLISFFLCLIFIVRLNIKNNLIIFFSFLCVVLFFNSFDAQRERLLNYTFKQITAEDKLIFYTTEHNAHFVSAYKIFLDNKIIGIGPNTFRHECKLKKYQSYDFFLKQSDGVTCSSHPHNFFIQLLSETGILGAIIPLGIFFFILYKFLNRNIFSKNFKDQNSEENVINFFLIFFILCLLPLTPNGNFFNNWLMIVYSLPVGFYLQSIYAKKKLL